MENKFAKNFIAPKYDDMVRGLNLTPAQDKELRNLYRRATVPVRPWGFVFAGVLAADMVGLIYAALNCIQTQDTQDAMLILMFMVTQAIALPAYAQRKYMADKKMHDRIDEIKSGYLRQISR